MNVELLTIEECVNRFNQEEFTCYRVAQIWSTLSNKHVREQMVYNYRKNNLIKVNSFGRVNKDELIKFLNKKLNK